MTMVYLVCVMVVVELDKQWGWTWSPWLLLPASVVILVGAAAIAARMPMAVQKRAVVDGRVRDLVTVGS